MKSYFILLLSLIAIGVNGQNSVNSSLWYPKDISDSKFSYGADINYYFNTGASISNFGSNGGAYNYFVAPSITVPINNKFSFTGGIIINQSQFSSRINSPEGTKNISQQSTQAIVYGTGVYRVNPNVTVFASGYYDMNAPRNSSLGMRRPTPANVYSPYGSEGFSLGAEFKIGEKTKIGIQMQYDNGVSPYYNSFGNNFYSPFR